MIKLRTLVMLAALALMAAAAQAQNVHFVGPLRCADQGTTLQVCGKLAGLGNAPVTIKVTATGTITATCTNQGGNEAPGINKVKKTATGTITLTPDQFDKNGTVSFCVSTQALTVTSEEAGCPNSNWGATVTDVSFTNIAVSATQSGKTVTATCG